MKNTREQLAAEYEHFGVDLLFADGFDQAIIGVDAVNFRVIYDYDTMVEVLISDGMSKEESIEYLDFNVLCAYVGEQTPIYAYKAD